MDEEAANEESAGYEASGADEESESSVSSVSVRKGAHAQVMRPRRRQTRRASRVCS